MSLKGIPVKNIVIISIVILVVAALGYYLIGRSSDETSDKVDDQKDNRPPTADAGFDQIISPGEEVLLNGSSSIDPDGDDLSFRWDLDDSEDTDQDGILDNDVDLMGEKVTWTYPIPENTVTYRVTLNVSDGGKWDKDTSLVTIRMVNNETPPSISMSCNHVNNIPGGPSIFDPHFVLTVEDVSRIESVLKYLYVVSDPQDNVLFEGQLQSLLSKTVNDTIRYRDVTNVTEVSSLDSILIRDNGEVPQGSFFRIYYMMEKEPSGEVEVSRG